MRQLYSVWWCSSIWTKLSNYRTESLLVWVDILISSGRWTFWDNMIISSIYLILNNCYFNETSTIMYAIWVFHLSLDFFLNYCILIKLQFIFSCNYWSFFRYFDSLPSETFWTEKTIICILSQIEIPLMTLDFSIILFFLWNIS